MKNTQPIQTVTNEQLYAKLCELEALLNKPTIHEHSREIWTIQDIADYLGFSYRHVYGSIISDPKFPAPLNLQSRTGSRQNSKDLYISGEVVQFCLNNKKAKARI